MHELNQILQRDQAFCDVYEINGDYRCDSCMGWSAQSKILEETRVKSILVRLTALAGPSRCRSNMPKA